MFGCAGRHSENRGVSSSTSAAGYDTAQLQVILRNRQKTGGVPKSAAIITAATALTAAGVHTARDLDPDSLVHRRAYCNVHGLGPVTWTHFTMPAGPSCAPPPPGHRLQVGTNADAAALARRTRLADPRGRPIRGLPAPIVAGGVCDAAAIWRGAFLVAGSLTEPHRSPALELVCPSLEAALALIGAARRLGITARTKHIRDADRVTVRVPAAITALLTTMGGPDTAAAWADRRTYRPEPTPTDRPSSFDDANQTRATHAAAAAAAGCSAPCSSSVTRCPKI